MSKRQILELIEQGVANGRIPPYLASYIAEYVAEAEVDAAGDDEEGLAAAPATAS